LQISLRSHLIAGTAAVVGAGAIAMNPVMGAQLSLPSIAAPSVAKVALAGLDSPISELLLTGILGGQLLFNNFSPPAAPGCSPGTPAGCSWGPSAFFQPIPWIANPLNGGYIDVGLVPQIISQHLPIISQLGQNGSEYLNAAIAGLGGAGYVLSEGVWNAVGQLLGVNIGAAVSTLISSVQAAGSLALESGAYVLAGVLARAQAVANIAIGSVPYLLGAGVAQLSFLVARSVKVVTDTFGALGSGNFGAAWNYAIDGLLGPTGIPGAILNLTIGAGQQIAVIPPGQGPNQDAPFSNFIPSIRTVIQSAGYQIAGIVPPAVTNKGLATPNPLSPPGASVRKAARSAASARSAAAVAAPVASAPAGDSSAAADSSAPAEKPATHRASRKTARSAS